MKFIDLFAGLGGFHLALRKLGHHCVFASEIDDELCALYKRNFGMQPDGSLRRSTRAISPPTTSCARVSPASRFQRRGNNWAPNASSGATFSLAMCCASYAPISPPFCLWRTLPTLSGMTADEPGKGCARHWRTYRTCTTILIAECSRPIDSVSRRFASVCSLWEAGLASVISSGRSKNMANCPSRVCSTINPETPRLSRPKSSNA